MTAALTPGVEEHLSAIAPVLQDLKIDPNQLKSELDSKPGASPSQLINTAVTNLANRDDNALSEKDVERVRLATAVAGALGNDKDLVHIADRDGEVSSVEDLAFKYSAQSLAKALPENGDDAHRKAASLAERLFAARPSPVVARLVGDGAIPLKDESVREELTETLISKDALTAPLSQTTESKGSENPAVLEELKKLRRINTIAPTPEAVAALAQLNLTSATSVASMTSTAFVKSAATVSLPASEAQAVHSAAVNTVMMHTNLLLSTVDIGRDDAPILDGRSTAAGKRNNMKDIAARLGINQVNFDRLFGGNDETLTEEWSTVYSPAAYFVDLLQYLRTGSATVDGRTGINSKAWTTLDYLLRKRPDLEYLDLTRENAEVTLPYVDVVNEIMESFITHFDDFIIDESSNPKQSEITSYNVNEESAADLNWRPQNTEIAAYAYLAHDIFPLSLPYHQPIDAARAHLGYLQIDRAELINKFRSKAPEINGVDAATAAALYKEKIDNAYDAEVLGLVEEEYILLTKEGFQSPEYLAAFTGVSEAEARKHYNIRPIYEHYGFKSSGDLQAVDGTGLEMVKGQCLRRTGITWSDLVDILQTKFINPLQPNDQGRVILDAIKSSYKYLQTLIIPGFVVGDPLKNVTAALQKDLQARGETRVSPDDIANWVKSLFLAIGNLIVLESNDGPFLRFNDGQIAGQSLMCVGIWNRTDRAPAPDDQVLPKGLILRGDGILMTQDQVPVGNVDASGRLLWAAEKPEGVYITQRWPNEDIKFYPNTSTSIDNFVAQVQPNDGIIYAKPGRPVQWVATPSNGGTSDIETVKLRHLDGSQLSLPHWDRLQLFIRLWKKLGWSVNEVDMALDAVSQAIADTPSTDTDDGNIGKAKISPARLHLLVIIKKVAELMGLPLEQTLTLWTNIPTRGKDSLYSRVFLRRNTPGTESIFQPDVNGRVLQGLAPGSLQQNALPIMANLDIPLADITALINQGFVDNVLNIETMSKIYRCKLISQFLGVSIADLLVLFRIFNSPLDSPDSTLWFLESWKGLEDAGFSVDEVAFITDQVINGTSPLAIDEINVAVTCKQLRDKIAAIHKANTLITPGTEVTADMVKAKVSLMFGDDKVDSIMSFINGTSLFTVDAPPNLILKDAIDDLSGKFKYFPVKTGADKPTGQIQSVGFLDPNEVQEIQDLLGFHPGDGDSLAFELWVQDIRLLQQQPQQFFNANLAGIFPDNSDLLKRTANQTSDTEATLLDKYTHVINTIVPQIISRQSEAAVVSAMAAVAEISDLNVASNLLRLIKAAPESSDAEPETALDKLTRVGTQIGVAGKRNVWQGYLTVPQTDSYVFYFTGGDEPEGFHLNERRYDLLQGDGTASGTYHTSLANPIRLNSHQLYPIIIYGASLNDLQWKTPGTTRQAIPDSSILPDVSSYDLGDLFNQFHRAGITANKFGLGAEDVLYIDGHKDVFSGLDFNALNKGDLQNINSFVLFRKSIPDTVTLPLSGFFNWCEASSQLSHQTPPVNTGLTPVAMTPSHQSVDASLLPKKIAQATGWDEQRISEVLKEAGFYNGDPAIFMTVTYLAQMGEMLDLGKKADVDISSLFRWARPIDRDITLDEPEPTDPRERRTHQNSFERQFTEYHRLALTIALAAQSKTSPDAYEAALRPVNDKLRENQRDAMIQYLINQDYMLVQGIQDADSLFEFFLIDVQTSALVETSRLRQAISTVQLFVQRCFLGLEKDHVSPHALDRDLWDWMKNYSTWAANRKVFLYPENWVEPSLRDNKSSIFKELEAEIAQNELTPDRVPSVIRNYVSRLADESNLEPVTYYCEFGGANFNDIANIHFFSRTKSAPYDHYHRVFECGVANWRPWVKMGIEIPTYVTSSGETGSYMIPTVLENRLIVFIPQITKNTVDVASMSSVNVPPTGATSVGVPQPQHYYEIRMSWTEHLPGDTWSPRQLSAETMRTEQTTNFLDVIETFQFLTISPIINNKTVPSSQGVIACYMHKGTDWMLNHPENEHSPYKPVSGDKSFFYFFSNQISTGPPKDTNPPRIDPETLALSMINNNSFPSISRGHFGSNLSSYQYVSTQGFYDPGGAIYWRKNTIDKDVRIELEFENGSHPQLQIGPYGQWKNTWLYHQSIDALINASKVRSQDNSVAGIKPLFDFMTNLSPDDFFGTGSDRREMGTPYALYNYELGLHIPMLLVDRLLQAQQFDAALDVMHFVFDPIAADGQDVNIPADTPEIEQRRIRNARFWRFKPFKDIQTTTLERYLLETIGSKPGQKVQAVTDWKHNPFQPHLVARQRPTAYMKWIVSKYIEILIAYGDFYFRQNTLDSIPDAIQMYVTASHLCGPRGEKIPHRDPKVMNYHTLAQNLDDFSNAIVQLEEQHPFSNQIPINHGVSPANNSPGLPTMFGFATAFYFSIPDNPQVRQQRDLIDDRLFKIRHSQDINGVTRTLPLFDPPLDPGMLIRAKAQGLSLSSVLGSISGPMPNYRFQYLLNRALDLSQEVKELGNSLLSVKEKYDGEVAAALRAKHETNIYAIGLDLKKISVREAEASLAAAEQSRQGPVNKLQYYLDVLGLKTKIPSIDEEFIEEAFQIETPQTDGNLRLLSYEKLEMDKFQESQGKQVDIGKLETLSGVFHALPVVAEHATPLGCGVAIHFGPPNLAYAMQAAASGLRLGADALTFQATSSGRKGNNTRALYERYLSLNQAGLELKSVDKQIQTARVRLELANGDVLSQQKQLDQANEYEEYLRSKFTNTELYSWIASSTKSLYYETYNHAYDLASKAVKAFKFERPRDATDYLQVNYWDPAREGLLSGERLHFALKQLETAYQNERGYDFEITKNVSLRQLDPLALMQLRHGHKCYFTVPEALYDLDFPGHYLRRIKSVAISIPSVVGPYTSVNAVLQLTGHKYRVSPSAGGGASGYAESRPGAGDDSRFATSRVPVSSIATSSGMDDSGMFELNFRDERYLPFEGAGAISNWTLELPGVQPQFSYESISDVILHIKYTSIDGGGALRDAATQSLSASLDSAGTGYVLVDIRNEFASSWAAVSGVNSSSDRVLTLPRMETSVPFYLRGRKLVANTINIISDVQLPEGTLQGDAKANPQSSAPVDPVPMKKLRAPIDAPALVGASKDGVLLQGTWSFTFPKGEEVFANRVWMLVKYSLLKN